MIVRLRGQVVEIGAGRLVIDCHGVGYEVHVPAAVLATVPQGEEAILHTRQIFREDGQLLVGFADPFDARLFDLLTEVKGCGPKVSLQIIGDLGAQHAFDSIATEDAKSLTRATGVGPRLAERIILELKEKVRQEGFARRAVAQMPLGKQTDDELVLALVALGYKRGEAEAAAEAVGTSGNVEERLRVALATLNR